MYQTEIFFFGDRRRERKKRLVRRELIRRATLFWRCVRACGKRCHFFGKLLLGKGCLGKKVHLKVDHDQILEKSLFCDFCCSNILCTFVATKVTF